MTRRQRPTLLLLIALTLTAAAARAQDAPVFDPGRIPAEGARAQEFVPAGWKIEARADGDLDGDRRTDHVLHLVPGDHESTVSGAAPESHALLILLSSEGGRLRRAALATRLLVQVAPQYSLELSIRNGVLVTNQNFGMTEVADLTHRFRYEPASGHFLLIGKDTFNYHRPQGPKWPATRVSENYLTGVRLTTTERWRGERQLKPLEKREQIERTRTYIEEVNEDFNE